MLKQGLFFFWFVGTPSLSGTTTLMVNIINSNDKDPYFTPATQRAEVAEDAPIGTVVYRLVALDPDVESSELLDYAATEPITAVDKDGKEVNNEPVTKLTNIFIFVLHENDFEILFAHFYRLQTPRNLRTCSTLTGPAK